MTIDAGGLPRRTLRAGTALYRIHRADRGPWYFSGDVDGRFNPADTPRRGACYWAEAPLGAWVESFRTAMTLTTEDLADRALSAIRLRDTLVVRDLTVKKALAAGVTAAVTAGGDYRESQALADALQGVADGIRYRVRHDLSGAQIGIAWFGDAGVPTGRRLAALPRATSAGIPEALIEEAQREFGYLVIPPPA